MNLNSGTGEWMKGGDCSYRLAGKTETVLHGRSVVFGGQTWIIRPEAEPPPLQERPRTVKALAA